MGEARRLASKSRDLSQEEDLLDAAFNHLVACGLDRVNAVRDLVSMTNEDLRQLLSKSSFREQELIQLAS